MASSSECPHLSRLESLVTGSLPDVEQEALTHHIEGCARCQQTIESLRLPGSSWADLAPGLAQTEPPTGPLRQALDRAKGIDAEATVAPTPGRPPAEGLEFLQPSEKPGHLGRLAQYEVLQVIGQGGFGTVLKAFDEKLHRMVAVKVLSPAYAASGSARKRFIREARAAAAVKNEHIVAIYDVQQDAQPPYLVMELIDGISLQDKLDQQGPLGVTEILRIGMQTAEGLAAAHKQGLVHRDIKPANILLENGVERVKITDFGLARAVDDASMTQSGTVTGTPIYMSPEQASGEPIDHRSDLFSLGTVMYSMCTGHPPFRATGTHAVLKRVIEDTPRPIRAINNEIPEWLEAIIAKLHAKKREERFQTANEVAELLGQHLAHLQQPTTVPHPAPVMVARRGKPADGDGAATDNQAEMLFPTRLMPRDGVDLCLAAIWAPLVIGLYWVVPAVLLYGALTGLGLAQWAAPVSALCGFMVFLLLLLVLGLRAAERAIVSRGGIELVRYAGSPTFVPWGKIRRIQEATRWEVFRRVWLWPGIPLRGSLMCSSALYQFRIEWDDTCYYFAPQDHVAFRKAVADFRAQAEKQTEPPGAVEPAAQATGEEPSAPIYSHGPRYDRGEIEARADSRKGRGDAAAGSTLEKLLEGSDHGKRLVQHGALTAGAVLAIPGFMMGALEPSLFPIGMAAVVASMVFLMIAAFVRQRWSVTYRGHAVRFENGCMTGETLHIDDVLVARGGVGLRNEIRATIPSGEGAGDEIVVLAESGLLGFHCRIFAERGAAKSTASSRIAGAARVQRWLLAVGAVLCFVLLATLGLIGLSRWLSAWVQGIFLVGAIVAGGLALFLGTAALASRPKTAMRRALSVTTVLAFASALAWVVLGLATPGKGNVRVVCDDPDVRIRVVTSFWRDLEVKPGLVFVPPGDFEVIAERDGKVFFKERMNIFPSSGTLVRIPVAPGVNQLVTPPAAHKDDKERLQGHWVAESVENEGNQLPPEACAKYTLTITHKRLKSTGFSSDRSEGTFHVDETVTPRQIDLIGEDRVSQFGIYRFDGDRLVVCMGDDDEKKRPTEFSSKGGKDRMVVVFKKASVPPTYKDDKERLQGHWVAESMDDGGQPLPPEVCAQYTLTFTGSKLQTFRVSRLDPDGMIFRLDETTQPRQIDIINKDRKAEFGIYRFDGDRLVLCIGDDDAKDRATEFSFQGGKRRAVMVFKRAAMPEPGWVQLCNGKDLAGWKGQNDAWKIQDGALTATKIGYIESERRITGNFRVRLQAKLRRGAATIRLIAPEHKHGWTLRLEADNKTGKVDGLLTYEPNQGTSVVQGIANLDKWFRLEIVATDRQVEVLVNDAKGPRYALNSGFAPMDGHLSLQVLTEPHDVAFKDIEFKELPPTPRPLPKKAADIPHFVSGAWKIESTVVAPKPPPEYAKMTGFNVFEPICGGSFLRCYTNYGNGKFESLLVQRYDDATDSVKGWFFSSTGDHHGPGVGRWNAETRTMLWLEKLPSGLHATYSFEFADVNTIKTRVYYTNDKNDVVFELLGNGTRLPVPVELKPAPIDPKRPAEMQIFDQFVGDWETQGNMKMATKKGLEDTKFTSQLKSRLTLGGRMIAAEKTGPPGHEDVYSLMTYDTNLSAYRIWVFTGTGDAISVGGGWDEKSRTLKWNDARRDGSTAASTWKAINPDRWEWTTLIRDAVGKTLYDIDATNTRKSK
jgi:serine/threonine-protein kinase